MPQWKTGRPRNRFPDCPTRQENDAQKDAAIFTFHSPSPPSWQGPDMTVHRFYLPPAQWNPDHLALDEAESHHCTDVLRLRPGQRVVVFNGEGLEVTAEISLLSKREVGLRPLFTHVTPKPAAAITLAQAVPKGKNMDLVIQKATELGAAEIVPLMSERTVVRLDRAESADKQEKWQRIAIEACKQCGQNHLPVVQRPVTLDRFFAQQSAQDLLIIAAIEPGARRLKELLAEWSALHPAKTKPASVLVLIGPEGDFTPAEIGLAKSRGCLPMSLGPIILRTETAAIYSLSTLAHELF
jgi:16S rRNA (uracil1498-N3)-methyltransferase